MEESPIILNPEERGFHRRSENRRGMIGLVMRLSGGRIKNEANANYFLLFFAIAIFVISIIIFSW